MHSPSRLTPAACLQQCLFACLMACLLQTLPAAAQGTPGGRSLDPGAEPGPQNPVIERIRVEDKGARIDELRVGGQTQSITVQPKNDLPAYEVRPATADNTPSAGQRVWNLRKF